ncbi:hypothetical protein [Kingella potus]|uniref:hypothetical protein n=1 Tax=Kingella potus TaxID=265175 RepID=UPI0011C06BF5|nr:hypothetical protein [Kingella potus]UOP01056.1 hypothetical protein LVJ84_01410 [Kingella potus]
MRLQTPIQRPTKLPPLRPRGGGLGRGWRFAKPLSRPQTQPERQSPPTLTLPRRREREQRPSENPFYVVSDGLLHSKKRVRRFGRHTLHGAARENGQAV